MGDGKLPTRLARLTAMKIKAALNESNTGKRRALHDGGGLYLSLDGRGSSSSWIYRYMVEGRARTMGLGSYPSVSLAMARTRAGEARQCRAEGHDPLQKRQQEDDERRRKDVAFTFRQAAESYIATKRDGWKSQKHLAQWSATLALYAFPIIGHLNVAKIDNAAVLRVLQQEVTNREGGIERFWTAKPETASRVRGRVESVLDWSIAGGHRTMDNCERWEILKHQLPARSSLPNGKVIHHRAFAIDAIPDFMARLRRQNGVAARALEFLILTAARSSEVWPSRCRSEQADAQLRDETLIPEDDASLRGGWQKPPDQRRSLRSSCQEGC